MDTEHSPVPRRGLLLGGAVVLGAVSSGCSLNNPFDEARTPAAEAVRDLSPDVGLAVTAAASIRAQQELLGATSAAHPALAALAAGFAPMHEAHLEALLEAVPDRVDLAPQAQGTSVPANRGAARTALLGGERDLRAGLVGLALRAESGPFARLLGSMAASVSQHLAVAAR